METFNGDYNACQHAHTHTLLIVENFVWMKSTIMSGRRESNKILRQLSGAIDGAELEFQLKNSR